MPYRAFAKVNLSLEVLGKRPDGYHDIASVMQTVSLADVLEIHDSDQLQFECSDKSLQRDDNLVLRAARLLREVSESTSGCRLVLHKAIPHAAGLGGGSSDAAATLRSLSEHWSLHLDDEQLVEIGSRLGSDVPFFLRGGTALVSGRGEFVRSLPEPEPVWYALIMPPIGVPTVAIFNELNRADWTDGARTRAVATTVCNDHRISLGINGMKRALFRLYPLARRCFEEVLGLAPGRVFVSGSGPTVCALCGSREEAEQLVAAIAREGWWTAVVHSIQSESA